MSDFFPEVHVSTTAAEAMARGLYAVAQIDGLHDREEALVASFWSEIGGSASALSDLKRAATIGVAELSAALPDVELRQLFIKTSLLLAWADGKVTDPERKIIGELAHGLGLGASDVAKLEAAVKEYLLGHLTSLSNSHAVAAVAKKLGV